MKKILIVGAGALGSWTSEMLVRAIPKIHITLIDFDVVTEENLKRQLYYVEDLGKPKVEVLGRRLRSLGASVVTIQGRIEDVINSIGEHHLALALTDNIESRLIVEKKFKTLHAMVRPEFGMILLTTEKVKLSNIMNKGRHRGPQDVTMVVTVASYAARVAKEYLLTGKSRFEGKLLIINPFSIEQLEL
jgi:hypothetical protein